jgi:deazaflavin-dependent oxidoreductase (nitroreductase family)
MRALAIVIGVVLVGVVVSVGTFVLGMRRSWPPVVDRVRRFNRRVTNRRVLRSAGAAGARASIVRHRGRATGRQYQTPVTLIPLDGGFLIALPYGDRSDWTKNVLAAGSAAVIHQGATLQVERPEVVATSEVAAELPASERRVLRLFNVQNCLRVSSTDRKSHASLRDGHQGPMDGADGKSRR